MYRIWGEEKSWRPPQIWLLWGAQLMLICYYKYLGLKMLLIKYNGSEWRYSVQMSFVILGCFSVHFQDYFEHQRVLSLFSSACTDGCFSDFMWIPLNTVHHAASFYGNADNFRWSLLRSLIVSLVFFGGKSEFNDIPNTTAAISFACNYLHIVLSTV